MIIVTKVTKGGSWGYVCAKADEKRRTIVKYQTNTFRVVKTWQK